MNKELREMLDKISNKKAEARKLVNDGKTEEAKAVMNEVKKLQEDFDILKDTFEDERDQLQNDIKNGTVTPEDPKPKNSKVKEFLNAVRARFQNSINETTPADGGYTVPEDISTEIKEYRESKDSLEKLVTVIPVKTNAGARTFKARADQTGFAEVAEGGDIQEKTTPKFSRLVYAIKKYAGFFSVTNEVLADSDANLRKVLVKWIGDESRVTRNKLILAVLGTKAKTAIANLDDIKHSVNVTLDPAFQIATVVVTNQSGYNWLDTLKDSDGRYLLQPNPTDKNKKLLFGLYPVNVFSNKDLPNDTTVGVKAPIFMGDLKEAVALFDREKLSIMASNVAGTAFLNDLTLFRAIEREDVKMRDQEAFVHGEIVIS